MKNCLCCWLQCYSLCILPLASGSVCSFFHLHLTLLCWTTQDQNYVRTHWSVVLDFAGSQSVIRCRPDDAAGNGRKEFPMMIFSISSGWRTNWTKPMPSVFLAASKFSLVMAYAYLPVGIIKEESLKKSWNDKNDKKCMQGTGWVSHTFFHNILRPRKQCTHTSIF